MTTWEKAAAPFPPDDLDWRVGVKTKDGKKGMALVYLTARPVMGRLDEVFGPMNWRAEFSRLGDTTICTLHVRVDGEWIAKQDGAGPSDIEADKGALSDAFKRAAVHYGIGRYLYRLDSPWVELDASGRIKHPPKLPAWALPAKSNGAPAPTGASPPASDAMTADQLTRYKEAIDKLRDHYFDCFDDALKAIGKSEADVRSVRYAKQAAAVFQALEAACAAALSKA